MPENPEVKVTLTAEDQGVSAAIRQLSTELKTLQTRQDQTAASAVRTTTAFKGMAAQALSMVKLRLANIPGLGGFGSAVALRAYEPVGKMLEEGAGDVERKFGAAALAIGGTTAAVAALGAVALAVTHHMVELAESIENASAATGLSTGQVQEYAELAKEMGLDANGLQTAFSRMNEQLGEFVATGKATGDGSQYFVRVLKEMNISLADAKGNLRPVNDILGDFADAVAKIPDPATRAAIETAALGTRGRVLAEAMEEATREGLSLRDVLASIDKSGNVIPDSQLANLMQARREWEDLARAVRGAHTELGEIIADWVTHPIKGLPAAALAMTGDLGHAARVMQALTPGPAVAPSAGSAGAGTALLLQTLAANEQLKEQEDTLLAGGKEKLELQRAEAGYAAAVKMHNTELVKAYATQISELKQIIAMEEEKKAAPGERRAAKKAEEERQAAARAAANVTAEANEAISGEIAKRIELQDRQWDKEREQDRTRLGFQEQILEAEGKTFDAAVLKIRQEEDEYYRAGGTVAEVNAYVSAEMTKVKADISRQNAERASAAVDVSKGGFGLEREAISDRLAAGQITERGAEEQYLALVRQEIPLLEQKARLELEAARASGDQQRILDAEQGMRSIQQLSQETTEMGQKWKTTLGTSMTSVLDQFTGKTLESLRSIGQAFGQMELAVVSALERTAMQMLVNYLTQKSIAEGTKLSDAETAAANVYAQVSAIPVVGWIMAPVAAAAAFATVLAFKRGGLVDGPGGPTADRVPAMLSAGEFVVNARAVNSVGAHNLEAINAGIATTSPNFAASIAHPGDFRAPAFQPPDTVGAGAGSYDSHDTINLYHNGPDAREILEQELVPRLLQARRMGKFSTP